MMPIDRAAWVATLTASCEAGAAAYWLTKLPVSSDTKATGPTASCKAEPKKVYVALGSTAAYKPAIGL